MESVRSILYHSFEEEKIRESTIELGITTTQLPSFQYLKLWKEQMEEKQLLEYIIASLYLPIFKSERIIDNHYYVDIAAFRKYPYEMLKEKNCNDIYLVHVGAPDLYRTIHTAKDTFINHEDVHIIYMKNKPSLLDFTKEQNLRGYQDGYETTMKVLTKTK